MSINWAMGGGGFVATSMKEAMTVSVGVALNVHEYCTMDMIVCLSMLFLFQRGIHRQQLFHYYLQLVVKVKVCTILRRVPFKKC